MTQPTEPTDCEITMIELGLCYPDPDQPRQVIDDERLQSLSEDIGARGLLQPILVCETDTPGTYIVKAGHRRAKACAMLGWRHIPAIVVPAGDDPLDYALDQLAENYQREDLDAVDLSAFFTSLHERFGVAVKDIAEKCEQRGMRRLSRPYISNIMRLHKLPDWAKEYLRRGYLTPSACKYLLVGAEHECVMEQLRERIGAHYSADSEEQGDDPVEPRRALSNAWVQNEVFFAFRNHFPRADADWHEEFEVDIDVEAHRDRLGVKNVRAEHYGGEFITNLEEWDRLGKAQAEALHEAAAARGMKMDANEQEQYSKFLSVLDRAEPLIPNWDRADIAMALDCFAEETPIDWSALAEADLSTFVHDVFGMLEDKPLFLPRCRLLTPEKEESSCA